MKKKLFVLMVSVLAISCFGLLSGCADNCKTGHVFGEFAISSAPTCIEEGTQNAKCKNCAETKTQAIAKSPHIGGTASCNSKASCSFCQEKYGAFDDHIFSKADHRILTYRGQGEYINYTTICAVCRNLDISSNSLGTFLFLNKVLELESHKVICDVDNSPAFNKMQKGKWLEVGTAQNFRTLAIDGKTSVAKISGTIHVVNGNLVVEGNVQFEGELVVFGTLTIAKDAILTNAGKITIKNGAVFNKIGTLQGDSVSNENVA